jgi:hypothetical protein
VKGGKKRIRRLEVWKFGRLEDCKINAEDSLKRKWMVPHGTTCLG